MSLLCVRVKKAKLHGPPAVGPTFTRGDDEGENNSDEWENEKSSQRRRGENQ